MQKCPKWFNNHTADAAKSIKQCDQRKLKIITLSSN